jgi:hypothetical protein
MSGKTILGLVSLALAGIGYGAYVLSVLRRRTRPHVFTWCTWTLVMGIAALAQLSGGAGAGGWVTAFSAVACLGIAVLALRHGDRNIARSDRLAFGAGLVIIPLWALSRNPLWAVVLASAIDAMAYYPTMRKSWLRPAEETWVTYSVDIVKWLFALSALKIYSAVTLIYPLFLLAANAGLIAIIVLRRVRLPNKLPN